MGDLATLDVEAVSVQRRFERRQKAVDGVSLGNEEVEVVRLAIHGATDDERTAAGEREALGLGEISQNKSDALLQRAQHARSTPRRRRNQSAQAIRTRAGTTMVSQSVSRMSTSMKRRTSSSVPSRSTCSYTRAKSTGSSRS